MTYGDSESNYYRIGDLERQIGELRSEFLSYQNESKHEISDLRESLKAVRDIAMAEIIAIKPKISDLESSLKYIRSDIEKLVTKQAESDKDSLWYRITEMENNLEDLDSIKKKIIPMIQTTLENQHRDLERILDFLDQARDERLEMKENQEKVERLYNNLMNTPITELVDKMKGAF